MPKIKAGDAKGLLIKFAVKIIFSTVMCVMLLNSLCSFIILKLDFDLSILPYIGTAICIISAIVITFISTTGFKNNYLMLSLISVMPLLIYTIINFCFNKTGAVFIIVKICATLAAAFIVSLIKSGKKTR